MTTKTELGKIDTVKFGLGGYQGAMIGLHFTFSFKGAGVGTSKCAWDPERIEWSKNCKWTEEDRDKQYAEIIRYLSKLLKEAKVEDVTALKGIPVEVTFEDNTLKSWIILTEVL